MAHRRTVHVISTIPELSKKAQEVLPGAVVKDVWKNFPKSNSLEDLTSEDKGTLQNMEILLADNNIIAQVAPHVAKLRWAHGTWAGVERVVNYFKDKPKPSYPITRFVEAQFAQLMAEYAVGQIINHERSWRDSLEYQKKCKWVQTKAMIAYRCLGSITVGIVGIGNIGHEIARVLKAFSTVVHGYKSKLPTPEEKSHNVDKYWHGDELPHMLAECDYIISVLPSTPTTNGILGGDTLKAARKSAVLINIGRGNVITEEDILRALDNGWISGAVLDVFEKEPLYESSPLWTHPKVVVTPHTAGVSQAENISTSFAANYERFTNGLPLLHQINWEKGY
ncbi:glyoxylate/hydroxypyruvate reductase A-like [Oratosquilla oratoria]|uniref:glyoxylate/hydroxypyruvate reductase A-like n=1 Tax=Oratosquilla oratoria TaxID=337810 RepID=UPI003F76D4D0